MRFPVICQSGAKSPSPVPLTGSLLLTAVILQTGAASQMSDADTATVTGVILWFGGHRTFGLAATAEITGAVVSRTVTLELQELEFPDPSVALHEIGVDPIGKVEPDAGSQLGAPTLQLSETVGLKETAAPVGPVHSAV